MLLKTLNLFFDDFPMRFARIVVGFLRKFFENLRYMVACCWYRLNYAKMGLC